MCFGIRYLAFCFLASTFWHTLSVLIAFRQHFYGNLFAAGSTHAFKGVRSFPKAVLVLTLGIQTRHSVSIRLHVHLNILEPCYQRSISFNNAKITLSLLTLFSCKIICFLM